MKVIAPKTYPGSRATCRDFSAVIDKFLGPEFAKWYTPSWRNREFLNLK